MTKLDNTLAVVTGASAGIGKYICEALLEDYADLTVIGLSRRKVEDIKNERFVSKCCDVSDIKQLEEAFGQIRNEFPGKKISVLVNNAGHGKKVPLLSDERLLTTGSIGDRSAAAAGEAFASQLNVNVLGLTMSTRLGVELMDHEFAGNIVNINSMSGHRPAGGSDGHFYSATKHAVTAITEGLRQELRTLNSKIRVGAISPGFVNTDFFQQQTGHTGYHEQMKQLEAEMGFLQSEDIYNALKMMVDANERCQVHDVLLRPTKQPH